MLEPSSDGSIILRMRETGFRQAVVGTASRWAGSDQLGELVGFLAVEPWQAGIRRVYEFRSSPERVWEAFADPGQFTAWWGGTDPVALRAGVVGWWVWPSEGGRFAVRMEVVEPPVYLAWCWTTEPEVALDDATQVLRTEWAFQPRDDGGTNLLLLETGFRGPKDHDLNSGGWDGHVIPALRAVLGEPAPAADASAS